MNRFEKYNKGDILKVTCGVHKFIIRYAGIDKYGLVKTSALWCDVLGYRDGNRELCNLYEVTAVTQASIVEETMLRFYIKTGHDV